MPAPTLQLDALRVRSLDIDFNEVSWEVKTTHVNVLDFTFQVLRSESPSGPFEAVSQVFEDRYLFVDSAVPGHRWRELYYVIRVTHKASGVSFDAGPVARQPEPDLVALELRRHMHLSLHEFSGRRCWVLPIRTFGQRCTCYDSTLGMTSRGGCRLCFGTGFARGYHHPIEVFMQIDPVAKTESVTAQVQVQQTNTSARCGYYPSLRPGDVVIEFENRRWRVMSVAQTEKGRAVVHQELTLHAIPPTDVEFTIPLNLDKALRDVLVSPERNYTNPQNLAELEVDGLSGVLQLYKGFER